MKWLRFTVILAIALSPGLDTCRVSLAGEPPAPSKPPRCKQCGWPLVGLSIVTDPVRIAKMHASDCPLGVSPSGQMPTGSAQTAPSGQSGASTATLGALFGFPTCRPSSEQMAAMSRSGMGPSADGGMGAAPMVDASGAPMATPGPTGSTGRFGGSTDLGDNGQLTVFGDLAPIQPVHIRANPNGGGNPTLGARSVAPPTFVRGFKIADNQSPMPVNRVYYDFNFFDNVWQKVNEAQQNGINRVRIYRQLIGVEKTFWDGYASIGARLPINTITADGAEGGQSTPTKTAINNFSIYSKFLFYANQDTKTYASWGVAATIPTGPQNFAGADYVRNYNNVELQPYLGFQKSWDRLYFLAFEAINVPLNTHDVTMIYNDFSLGYFIYKAQDKSQFIQGIAPTLELHVNIPLNHRDVFNFADKAGSADVVDFTYGLNVFFQQRTQLGLGLVTPISGPRPFSLEALAFLNVYF